MTPPVDSDRILKALKPYQVMAVVTGSFLIALTVTTIAKYVGKEFGWENPTFLTLQMWIGIVHGWIFAVYALTCFLLWSRMKWRLPRLAVMALGGIIPVMSFVVERKVSREVAGSLSA